MGSPESEAPRKKDDAREAIIREWDIWSAQHAIEAKVMNGILFFAYLTKDRPDLLMFKRRGDKWQDDHGWLLGARRVSG